MQIATELRWECFEYLLRQDQRPAVCDVPVSGI